MKNKGQIKKNESDQKFLFFLEEIAKDLPRFRDGRINYKDSKKAAVVVCFVKVGKEILLLKRSDQVWTYKGKWNTVAGYLDEFKPVKQKALEEIWEEIGVKESEVKALKQGKRFQFSRNNTTWFVHPFLFELDRKPKIKLDFEHTEYVWIEPSELKKYDVVPNALESWRRVS